MQTHNAVQTEAQRVGSGVDGDTGDKPASSGVVILTLQTLLFAFWGSENIGGSCYSFQQAPVTLNLTQTEKITLQ